MPSEFGHIETLLTDRFRIEALLGEGAMASVFRAEDLKHGRRVALKFLKPELAAALGAERFQREIVTTANLRHPHILPLYDSGEIAGPNADTLFYYCDAVRRGREPSWPTGP